MIELGYIPNQTDLCIYTKRPTLADGSLGFMLLSLYVDDTLIACCKQSELVWDADKAALSARYKIKDLGDCNWILNMTVTRDRKARTISLSQQTYVKDIVARFDLAACKPAPTPAVHSDLSFPADGSAPLLLNKGGIKQYQSMVGALMYAAITTRIDISYAVNLLSRHLAAPAEHHLRAAKRCLRYLSGTASHSLIFGANADTAPAVEAFTDSDWANDKADRRSITGTIIKCFGSTVSWLSKKQKTVALSSAEAEYMSLSITVQELRWLHMWLKEVFQTHVHNIPLYSDSQSAIAISDTGGSHQRTKHIDVRHHHVREHVQSGLVNIQYISTDLMQADILTKALGQQIFQRHCKMLLSDA